jgi:hypothetical protein
MRKERFWLLIRVAIIAAVSTVSAGLASVYFPAWWLTAAPVFVLSVFYMLTIAAPDFEAVWEAGKPLSGLDCVELKNLAEAHPEIAGMVARVQDLERPVTQDDLDRAIAWLYAQDLVAQSRACRELNGLASV